MDLEKFREFYNRVGFWKFWLWVVIYALLAYGLFLLFTRIVGPYVVGLWLTQG